MCPGKKFWQDLGLLKVKKHPKMASLPHFWHTQSSLGRMKIWRGKWAPNWEIPVGLESRQDKLSNKPIWAHFGHLQCPKTGPKVARHTKKLARRTEEKLPICSHFVKFRFATSPSGPDHLNFGFLAPKVAFKVFFLHIGFYPSGEGRQTVTPMPNVMFAALHL